MIFIFVKVRVIEKEWMVSLILACNPLKEWNYYNLSTVGQRYEKKVLYFYNILLLGCNGITRIDVILLSADDGRRFLVHTARKLSSAVTNLQLKCNDIVPANLDAILQGKLSVTDRYLTILMSPTEYWYIWKTWKSMKFWILPRNWGILISERRLDRKMRRSTVDLT